MKTYLLTGAAVLLLISLFGVAKTFTTPAAISSVKPVKILEYQQQGSFDYKVTAKPVYFYADSPAPTSDSSPQIPVKFIENFTVGYTYHPANTDGGNAIKINAILESTGTWKKTIALGPVDSAGTTFSIPIDLKYFQDLADTIEKEIGTSASTHDLTIQAVVSNRAGSDFIQLLPIKMSKAYIKIGDNLDYSDNGYNGRFDYAVKLGENTLFGPVTLTSPSGHADTADVILGQKDTIFTKFIDALTISYNYDLTSSQAVNQIQSEVNIEAILESPDKWSKTYTLLPPAHQNGEVNFTFPLDLKQYSSIFDTIQQETGILASTENLTLKTSVHTTAQTAKGSIDKTFTQSITTDLRAGLLTWTGDLKKTSPGSIDIPQTVKTPAKMLGLPVLWLRIVSVLISVLILAWLTYYYIRPTRRTLSKEAQESQSFLRKYRDIIIDVAELPELKPGQNALSLDSPQSLVKVAQGLLKPVNHASEDGYHLYWVNDDSTRYEFRLPKEPLPAAQDPAKRPAK